MDLICRLAYKFFDGLNFVTFVKRFHHLRGHVTDLLIGDLLMNGLMKSLRPLRLFGLSKNWHHQRRLRRRPQRVGAERKYPRQRVSRIAE